MPREADRELPRGVRQEGRVCGECPRGAGKHARQYSAVKHRFTGRRRTDLKLHAPKGVSRGNGVTHILGGDAGRPDPAVALDLHGDGIAHELPVVGARQGVAPVEVAVLTAL